MSGHDEPHRELTPAPPTAQCPSLIICAWPWLPAWPGSRLARESPTLGFTHLQFEALLTPARQFAHPCDFALVAMLGLLGLRIFEATGADIADLGTRRRPGAAAPTAPAGLAA